jgi:Na+-driven multidrug efflux pump
VTFSLSGVVRSTGAVWWPLAIMIISMVAVRIPFASLLSGRYGADAIWWSFPLGTLTSAALTSLYYRYGGWRRAHMLEGAPLSDAPDAAAMTPPPESAKAVG